MKKAYKNPFYGFSVFLPFKQPTNDKKMEVKDIQNPMYEQILSMRGHNTGFYELKGVKLSDQKDCDLADIQILTDNSLLLEGEATEA